MKVSGKGVIIILVFLVAIPCIVDSIVSSVVAEKEHPDFGMTGFLLMRYLTWLPVYTAYLGIAFTVLYLLKKYKQNSSRKK